MGRVLGHFRTYKDKTSGFGDADDLFWDKGVMAGFRNRRGEWDGGFTGDRVQWHPFMGREAVIQLSKSGNGGRIV